MVSITLIRPQATESKWRRIRARRACGAGDAGERRRTESEAGGATRPEPNCLARGWDVR